MSVKEQLQQIRKINVMIDYKLREIESLRTLAESTTVILKSDPVQSSSEDKIGSIVARIVDLEHDIDSEIDNLVDIKTKLYKTIEQLDVISFELMYKRYFEFKSWDTISNEMSYSRQGLWKLHGKILQKLESGYTS